MDYMYLVKGLIAEAKRGLQFQRMGKLFKILAIIGLLPLIVLTTLNVVIFYVLLFFYKAFISPVEYLHKIIKKEAQEVKHAAQFAIYWLAFPVVFGMYVLQAFATVMFYFAWFGLMLSMYLVTLGGVTWQPFVMDAKYETVDAMYEVRPSDRAAKIFTIVLVGSFALYIIANLLIRSDDWDTIMFGSDLMTPAALIYFVTAFIANPILFKHNEYVPQEEDVVEEVVEEE